jgi:iron complex transport system ATP-binding protein
MIPPALSVEGVVIAREQRRIVDKVHLCLAPGEFVSIHGPSGAGKSTLLLTLAGLLPAARGRVMVAGYELNSLTPRERAQRLSIATQSPVLPSELTVLDLVRLGRLPYEAPARAFIQRMWRRDVNVEAPVHQAIAAVGLQKHARCTLGSLSGGERRRAHLARVLAQETPLLLLDEPTTHLDEVNARQLRNELERRAEQGTAILVVTHDRFWINRFCNRELRLANGRLLPTVQRHHQTYTAAKPQDDVANVRIASMEDA